MKAMLEWGLVGYVWSNGLHQDVRRTSCTWCLNYNESDKAYTSPRETAVRVNIPAFFFSSKMYFCEKGGDTFAVLAWKLQDIKN